MPESSHSAKEASRHVGAVEATPRPRAVANESMISESADAASAPATMGVHCRPHGSSLSAGRMVDSLAATGVSIVMAALPQAEQGKDEHDDDDQADKVDDPVHA